MKKKVSVVLPCLNEEENLKSVIDEIKKNKRYDIEIIVVDNGSTDNSHEIAKKENCVVHIENNKGYGNAIKRGINEASNEYIIMGDADGTYNFSDISSFIEPLKKYDIVIGNRFMGGIEKGAMPILNKIGNKFLSGITKRRYKATFSDFHCGLRSFKKSSVDKLNLTTGGMEFASEMMIKAVKNNLDILEIKTTLKNSKYKRVVKLRPIRDGFRHLKLIMSVKK